MSVLTEPVLRTRRPVARQRVRRGAGSPMADRSPGRVTLEDFVVGIWAGIEAGRTASCPICSGDRLEPTGCADCGAQLS